MDSEYSLKDVVRCHLCENSGPTLHCVICNKHLCENCKGKHLSDKSKEHKVVPLECRRCFPNCPKHFSTTNICLRYCDHCKIPICSRCVSSDTHRAHAVVDIMKLLENKKRVIQNDLQGLERLVSPKYQELVSNLLVQKAKLCTNSQKLTSEINKHREEWHNAIDTIVQKMISDLHETDSKHLTVLNKREEKIRRTISKIIESITHLKTLLESNDVSRVSAYKSRNDEFRKLPLNFIFSLPSFTTPKIIKEHIHQQFGSLSAYTIETEDQYQTIDIAVAESPLPERLFIYDPLIITNINTKYGNSVACASDEDLWVCSDKYMMSLYNIQGELVRSISTNSGYTPSDITVTSSGDLVYTDYKDKSVNIVKNTQIQTVIRLQGWGPRGVCCASSGDLLVVMASDGKHAKVVRYSGSTEKQSIKYNDDRKPLFSCGESIKFISENRNLDICVSDYGARAVVVVNQAGKFRFTYSGPSLNTKWPFSPRGITTDSQSRILTADNDNHCIHILDHDGQFLRYIDNCDVQCPYGLCLDTREHLCVSESVTGKVKKVRYYL